MSNQLLLPMNHAQDIRTIVVVHLKYGCPDTWQSGFASVARLRCQCQGIRNNEAANIQEHNFKAIRGLGCATQACEPWNFSTYVAGIICNGNFALVPKLEAKFSPEFVEERALGRNAAGMASYLFPSGWKE